MTRLSRGERYSGVAILLHWAIAFFVIVNLIVGLGHESIPAMRAWMPGHKAIGITVLVLTLVRLAWRLGHQPPPLAAGLSSIERGLAHATHWALYALLILLPLSGWVMVSGPDHRRPLTWFGAFDIPYLPASAAASNGAGNAHGLLGWLMLGLVAIHIAAALRHHFILRDTTLTRIAPVFSRR